MADFETQQLDADQLATKATVVDGGALVESRPIDAPLEPGASLGRYVVLDVLGKGGMGVVYKAYDPELDRQIAVKLVRVRGHRKRAAQKRLLREAQALAQLSHPNVISVFDVGTIGHDVFISMELVDGVDVRQWLKDETRSRQEIMAVFLAAGKGLGAAHRAGLIHRDFKPDNIVLGNKGRPRIIDFGLARGTESYDDSDEDLSSSDSLTSSQVSRTGGASRNHLNTPMTLAGLVMGTPAYMSPEQHKGEDTDARSDQYSFCASLYSALYGVRPYTGDSHKELKENILAGQMAATPSTPKVPRWIRTILLQGLSLDPDERYDSMEELLGDLAKDPVILRNRVLRVAGFATVVAGAAFWFGSGASVERNTLCQDGPEQLNGVWDSQVGVAMELAFSSTGSSHASETYTLVKQRLGLYSDKWLDMYKSSCEATSVRGDQSQKLLDLRTVCLQRKLGKMSALTSLLSHTDEPSVVDRAVSAVASLPSIDACADLRTLSASVPQPEDAEVLAKVQTARRAIDEAEALTKAGDLKGALKRTSEIVETIGSINYPAVQAEALWLLGVNQRRLRMPEKAEENLYKATLLAAESHNDNLAALVWLEILWVEGYSKGQTTEEVLKLGHIVEAVVLRSGSDARRGDLMNNFGAILRRKGKYKEAKERIEQAIEIWEKVYGADSLQVAKAHNNLGNVLNDTGDFLEARKHHEKVLSIRQRSLGEKHPFVATALNNLGNSYMEEGDFEGAKGYYTRSLDIAETIDLSSGDTVMALNNLGNATSELGDFKTSLTLQKRALKIQEDQEKPDNSGIGITLNNLGDLYLKQKKYKLAVEQYTQAQARWLPSIGPDHAYMGYAEIGIANAYLQENKYDAAYPHFAKTLQIWGKSFGRTHSTVALALEGLGRSAKGMGQAGKAIEHFTKAMTIYEAEKELAPLEIVRFQLAQAHWDSGAKEHARDLAKQSHLGLSKVSDDAQDELAEIAAWLEGK
ncbi:MAG: serine/threonine protein kinase [Kofleriaceae bacterium]|nr:serine/threonine protein kinase [Kofleriaceae bacterium]